MHTEMPPITAQSLSNLLVKNVDTIIANHMSVDTKSDSLAASYVAGVLANLSTKLSKTPENPHIIAQALHQDASYAVVHADRASTPSFPDKVQPNGNQIV